MDEVRTKLKNGVGEVEMEMEMEEQWNIAGLDVTTSHTVKGFHFAAMRHV